MGKHYLFKRFLLDLLRPRQRVTRPEAPKDYMYYENTNTEHLTGEFYELNEESDDAQGYEDIEDSGNIEDSENIVDSGDYDDI